MKKIKAKVNTRLLAKANRLFTGTVEGRVIELLQNARRAGATKVEITNENGVVTVRDNGKGIEDFAKLLDLGGSGWDETFEPSEDPAGVGLSCLAGREVTIRSRGKKVSIGKDGWLGKSVAVLDDSEAVEGTVLGFADEPWTPLVVEPNAVFCGMEVTVDGKECEREPFVSDKAQAHSQLGCSIEAKPLGQMGKWHDTCRRRHSFGNVLVNFHGQVVSFEHHPVDDCSLGFLVELTGEPTGIRLMLPARTCLVENKAFEALKAAIELEAFHHLLRQGHHQLPYKDFLRAKELGIELPESTPAYDVGLLEGDTPEPVAVTMPEGSPLAICYRLSRALLDGDPQHAANAHLLGALGKHDGPFVPVRISECYDGYSWAKLPTIEKVDVATGKEIGEASLGCGRLICVESLTITAHTSDGKVYSSPVCMAVTEPTKEERRWFDSARVYVTREARKRLYASDIWFHVGGYWEDGDTYDTQATLFSNELDEFWLSIDGPNEPLRAGIMESLGRFARGWKSVSATADGVVRLVLADGSEKMIAPPRVTVPEVG